MSEELIQSSPKRLGRYYYYKIGSTTLSQLKTGNVIRNSIPSNLSAKKPDGLIILPGGYVKAVVEYKVPDKFKTKKHEEAAVEQSLCIAKHLCKVLIVTSGERTIWINSLNGEHILAEGGSHLARVFDAKPIIDGAMSREEMSDIEHLIDKIDQAVTPENNTISPPQVLDPTDLAKKIWQDIWIRTGKNPVKCLYNVVELFVFKFLSDVGVLNANCNFTRVFQVSVNQSPDAALEQYALISRREIQKLFPVGEDGTTIINGTIFVNERGQPNLAQAGLFGEALKHLQDYDNEAGSFRYIQKEFKTRLYESFLRQNAGIRVLGQYFTPRNVIKAIISMSVADRLVSGQRVCDPFCGVGGFLLELIAENKEVLKEFKPVDGKVAPQIDIVGYDKGGDEKEDERTIVLAKANMLIYFSDLLVKYNTPGHLKSFSKGAFNKVFQLLRSNLGTFKEVNVDPFDLIITNPPYVTSGSSALKREIEQAGLADYYTWGGRGTESLALEWIIKHLKNLGQALIVVPDGLLNQTPMLNHLKTHCFVEGVVSLPIRTFYATPKKTYILALIRKSDISEEQVHPVFTYLVSEIGETKDANRWTTEQKNDLIEMAAMFKQFKSNPEFFKSTVDRCKIVPYATFSQETNWMVDRWWSREERVAMGVDEEISEITHDEFVGKLKSVAEIISDFVVAQE